MKTIGLIGGTSWYSSEKMYHEINQTVSDLLGGYSSARMVLYSINFADFESAETVQDKTEILTDAAMRTQAAGADYIALCSNGLHAYAPQIQQAVQIPFIHIADATAHRIIKAGFRRVGLMGVRVTMEREYYKSRLTEKGLTVSIPREDDRIFMDQVLFGETGMGIVKASSSIRFYEIATQLMQQGAECVILGCTEIGMLMQQENTSIPLFDTTRILGQRLGEICAEIYDD